MNQKEAETLIATIRGLVTTQAAGGALPATPSAPPAKASLSRADEDELFQRLKARIIEDCRIDPILLQLLVSRPEIVIDVEPRVVTLEGGSLKGRIARLVAAGFFATAKTQGACRAELRRTGSDVNSGNLSTAFNDFVRDGYLTREGDSYVCAPGLKVTEREVIAR